MSPPSTMNPKSRIKTKEDDLELFKNMLMKEKDEFLLCSADELEDSLSKFKYFPDFKSNAAAVGESDDLLNADCEKNDYEWLMTPPETPLFPSLDDENPKAVNQTTVRRNSSLPKKLSTSNPRSSTPPPIKRMGSISGRSPSRGSSPTRKSHKSQPKSISSYQNSLSDRPPLRTKGLSPVLRRNSISLTASIISSGEDTEESSCSRTSIRKNESFSNVENYHELYHGNSEDIFKIIMANIPRRTFEEKERIGAHRSVLSMNSFTITSSDGSSSGADDRSEKMLDIDRHQGTFSLDMMEVVAAIVDEMNTNTVQEDYTEEHEHPTTLCLDFSNVSLSESSQRLETSGRDVDFFQIHEEKAPVPSDFRPLHVNVDVMVDESDAEINCRISNSHSSSEVSATALTVNDEEKLYPLLQVECGLDVFPSFSRTGSLHRRVHSFSSYQNARNDHSERLTILKRSNSYRRPLVADSALISKPSSTHQNEESQKSQSSCCREEIKILSIDSSSSSLKSGINSGEAEVDNSLQLLSLEPHKTLISCSIETVDRIDTNWGNSLDDENLSYPVNFEEASQESCPKEVDVVVSDDEPDDENFIFQPIMMETSPTLSSTPASSHGVLIGLTEGESGTMTKTKSWTLQEVTDTVLFCSSIVQDLAFQATSIAMEREKAQPLTVDNPTKSTSDEKSMPDDNGEEPPIPPLKTDSLIKAASRRPLKGESPQKCSCSVM